MWAPGSVPRGAPWALGMLPSLPLHTGTLRLCDGEDHWGPGSWLGWPRTGGRGGWQEVRLERWAGARPGEGSKEPWTAFKEGGGDCICALKTSEESSETGTNSERAQVASGSHSVLSEVQQVPGLACRQHLGLTSRGMVVEAAGLGCSCSSLWRESGSIGR